MLPPSPWKREQCGFLGESAPLGPVGGLPDGLAAPTKLALVAAWVEGGYCSHHRRRQRWEAPDRQRESGTAAWVVREPNLNQTGSDRKRRPLPQAQGRLPVLGPLSHMAYLAIKRGSPSAGPSLSRPQSPSQPQARVALRGRAHVCVSGAAPGAAGAPGRGLTPAVSASCFRVFRPRGSCAESLLCTRHCARSPRCYCESTSPPSSPRPQPL